MKHDSATKEYFNDNARFADLVNFYVYNGENVVKEDQLRNIDMSNVIFEVEEATDTLKEAICEMAIKTDGKTKYIIAGIENPIDTDYGIVVKALLYDALAHKIQMQEFGNMSETNCLKPVITIVLYYGDKKWDGAENLRDLVEYDEELEEFVPNYHLNLIDVCQLKEKDLKKFHTDIKKVFQFIQVSNDREKMEELLNNDEYYKRVDPLAFRFLNRLLKLGL